MKVFWIVIADAGRAVVLSKVEGTDESEVLHELENPAGRLHTSEIVSDQAGHMNKGDRAHSAMDPRTDAHESKAIDFAKKAAYVLDQGANLQAYDHLILIAPAHFLGLLRADLGPVAKNRIGLCEAKDLTHASRAALEHHIAQVVRLPFDAAAV